ncbi:MAG: phage protease [Puniceicoccales bacterium]|nr:phage protease [Puniceicoccales bacterium]
MGAQGGSVKSAARPAWTRTLLIKAAFDAGGEAPAGELMVFPAGEHVIHATANGEPVTMTVRVDEATVAAMNASLTDFRLAGKRPFFDFDHANGPASAWPLRFFWKDGPAPGVYAQVEWSQAGLAAVKGRNYRCFSPAFFTDCANPRLVIGAPLNMGGLVNDPAFERIAPVWAKNNLTAPGADAVPGQQPSNMEQNMEQNMELEEIATALGLPGVTDKTAILEAAARLLAERDEALARADEAAKKTDEQARLAAERDTALAARAAAEKEAASSTRTAP